jgi:hypothetical protein
MYRVLTRHILSRDSGPSIMPVPVPLRRDCGSGTLAGSMRLLFRVREMELEHDAAVTVICLPPQVPRLRKFTTTTVM